MLDLAVEEEERAALVSGAGVTVVQASPAAEGVRRIRRDVSFRLPAFGVVVD